MKYIDPLSDKEEDWEFLFEDFDDNEGERIKF